jgi:ankyrin repeat protein
MGYELDLPLNSLFVLIEQRKWKDIDKAMDLFPGMGSETFDIPDFYDGKTSSKVTALHLACKYQAPPAVINSLYKENPRQVVLVDSKYQRTALHIAVMNGIEVKSLKSLLKYNPKATEVQDALGRLALHYACRSNEEVVKMFVESLAKAHPQGARTADSSGFLPIHVACRCNAPKSIIKLLIRLAPETVFSKTKKGSSVVSCATLGKCPDDVMKTLEKARAQQQ